MDPRQPKHLHPANAKYGVHAYQHTQREAHHAQPTSNRANPTKIQPHTLFFRDLCIHNGTPAPGKYMLL
jgi:hypothetical protein